MNAKWTQGPWTVDKPFPMVVGTKDGRPVVIADVQYRNNQHPGSIVLVNEGLANARLIAAAPDLVRALDEYVKWNRGDSILTSSQISQMVNAALAKARGEG